MYAETYEGINSFLIGASKLLQKEGVRRETRGSVCFELPEPAMFKILNPRAREVTIPERIWNRTLPYAESLWIASGRNDMGYIIGDKGTGSVSPGSVSPRCKYPKYVESDRGLNLSVAVAA